MKVSLRNRDEWELTKAAEEWPEPLRGATLLRTDHDRRHATMLARGRVWKTHVVSGRKPDQVTVAFGAGSSSELVWSWRTSPEVAKSIVRLRQNGVVREFSGDSETIVLNDLLNDPVVRRHTVRVNDLEPATDYEYALGDGSVAGMTTWTTVRTAPRSGDVRLLYMGQFRVRSEGWGKLLATADRNNPTAAALLIAGDLVDRGNERTNWDHFFLRASGVFERLPLMPCVGNHEYLDRGPWLYRSIFTLPANGPAGVAPDLVYSFEMGDAFIAVLDSILLAVSQPDVEGRRQAEWLDEQLSRTRRTWKLVMFHHPLYASHTWARRILLPTRCLGARHRPASCRSYRSCKDTTTPTLRTYPMHAHRRVASTKEGTVYVVAVSGDKYCDQDPRDYTEVGFTQVSTYQTIDLLAESENRLVYKAFDALGTRAATGSRSRSRARVRGPSPDPTGQEPNDAVLAASKVRVTRAGSSPSSISSSSSSISMRLTERGNRAPRSGTLHRPLRCVP